MAKVAEETPRIDGLSSSSYWHYEPPNSKSDHEEDQEQSHWLARSFLNKAIWVGLPQSFSQH